MNKMAVNSYRFIAMYLIIGMVIGILTAFAQSQVTTDQVYDLGLEDRIGEVATTTENIYEDSETLVQANQFVFSTTYGDERALGRNWVEVFKNGFLPTGLIPEDQKDDASELERSINQLVIWFRWIILLFAGYEIFQMIIRKVT